MGQSNKYDKGLVVSLTVSKAQTASVELVDLCKGIVGGILDKGTADLTQEEINSLIGLQETISAVLNKAA